MGNIANLQHKYFAVFELILSSTNHVVTLHTFQLDFYIDNDMIHIADTKVAHRYGDFFIRKILKFEELNRKLHHLKL